MAIFGALCFCQFSWSAGLACSPLRITSMTVPPATSAGASSTATCFSCFPALVRRGNGGTHSSMMKGRYLSGDGPREQSSRELDWNPEPGPSPTMLRAIAQAKACSSPGICDGSCCCIRGDVSLGVASTAASSPVVGYHQPGQCA